MPTNKFKHILIFGPVAADQIAANLNVPPDWSIQFVNQAPSPAPGMMENGSAAFAALVGKINGDILEHYAPGSGRIVIGSFSAGHGALEWIFAQHGGDKRIAGVCCGDSYYISDEAFKAGQVKPGYLRQTTVAAQGGPPFLMMSSTNGGPGYVSSSQATSLLAKKLGATTTDQQIPKTYTKGHFYWTDMGSEWTHVRHATLGLPEMINHATTYEDKGRIQESGNQALGRISDGIDSTILTYGFLAVAAFFAFGGRRKRPG